MLADIVLVGGPIEAVIPEIVHIEAERVLPGNPAELVVTVGVSGDHRMADREPIHGDTVKLHGDALKGRSVIVGHIAGDVAEAECVAQLGCHRIDGSRGFGDIGLNDVIIALGGVANIGGLVGPSR